MKRLFFLFTLLAALQLSAQNNDSDANRQPQTLPENINQGKVQMHKPQHQNMSKFEPFDSNEQPPAVHQRGEGRHPFDNKLSRLSEKDQKIVEGYMKDLHRAIGTKENELQLRKAELHYLSNLEKPNINQISAKLEEISKIETAIQLEKIKNQIKIKEQFPDLAILFNNEKTHQRPHKVAGERKRDLR